MKKIRMFLLVAIATVIVACSNDYEHLVLEIPEIPIIPEIVAETIPLSDALEEMFSVFDLLPAPEGGLRSTRSAMEEQMSVATIYAHHVGASTRFATRSTSQEDEDVPLLYVVNFEGGGFSILAASTHITESVLVISDEDNFDPNHFLNTNNPFIPCEELGSDFRLFNAAENDYYVANYDEIGQFIASMIVQFAMYPPIDWDMCPELPPCEQPSPAPPTPPTPPAPPAPWVVVRQVSPMLTWQVATWRQGYPFNARMPIRGMPWNRGSAPVGCVPLALGQIMAFNEIPRHPNWDGRTAPWHQIQQFTRWCPLNSNAGLAIASMLNVIRVGVNATSTRNWTFATPNRAARYLERIGFLNVERHIGWNEGRVLRMLGDGKPVFQAAVSGLVKGHAWVIDGYMIRERGGTRQTLLHCVWGWGGGSNGWYTSGIFNPSRYNFTWGFRTITYDLP